ncbi:MAG: hypothetical protein AB7E24_00630 [Novosphingobium sp.]
MKPPKIVKPACFWHSRAPDGTALISPLLHHSYGGTRGTQQDMVFFRPEAASIELWEHGVPLLIAMHGMQS